MVVAINNMEKPTINLPEVPEDKFRRVEIFIWENKYKEDKRKETNFQENNNKT